VSNVPLTPYQRDLVARNVGLAQTIANEYQSKSSEFEQDELVAIAYQGLMQAAQRFDPGRDTIINQRAAFSGFARRRINGAILDWQRSEDHVQRSYRRIFRDLVRHGWGNGATIKDLVESSQLPEKKIREVLHAVRASPVGFETLGLLLDTVKVENGSTLTFDPPAKNDVESDAVAMTITEATGAAYQQLTEIQQVVLALRYSTGLELQMIAAELGLSLTLVRQAHTDAIMDLHAAMRSRAEDKT
jgi:RNA polymerase sigma factor (sigma-70 family)